MCIWECILALRLDSKGEHKSKVRWFEGIYLGIREESGDLIVGTPEGVIQARDFRRHGVLSERWNIQTLHAFKGIPLSNIPGREVDDIKSRIHLLIPWGLLIQEDVATPKPIHAQDV